MGLLSDIFKESPPTTIKVKDKFSYVRNGGYESFYLVGDDGVIYRYYYSNAIGVYAWKQFTIGMIYEIPSNLLDKVDDDN